MAWKATAVDSEQIINKNGLDIPTHILVAYEVVSHALDNEMLF